MAGELHADGITGATILKVRPMTKAELRREGWEDEIQFGMVPMALVLDSGVVLYPSQDDEGNGGGCLFGCDARKGNRTFALVAVPAGS